MVFLVSRKPSTPRKSRDDVREVHHSGIIFIQLGYN